MTNISQLTTTNPQPETACLAVKCGDCIHFKGVPIFRAGGELVSCSNEKIGRAEHQTPCDEFVLSYTLNNSFSPQSLDLLAQLSESLAKDMRTAEDNGSRSSRARLVGNQKDAALALMQSHHAAKSGYQLGAKYNGVLPGDEKVKGTLVGLSPNKKRAVLRTKKGTTVTVDSSTLTLRS